MTHDAKDLGEILMMSPQRRRQILTCEVIKICNFQQITRDCSSSDLQERSPIAILFECKFCIHLTRFQLTSRGASHGLSVKVELLVLCFVYVSYIYHTELAKLSTLLRHGQLSRALVYFVLPLTPSPHR